MTSDADFVDAPLVLVADDDPTHRVVVQEVLQQSGFRVLTVPNGQVALDVFAQAQPDILLLDIDMPIVDGFTVCERIRAKETDWETPILMVTGFEDKASVERAYDIGATDFISKPIAWPVLPHRLRYIIRTNAAMNDLKGLIRAVPDLIFVVNAGGEVQRLVSDPNGEHIQKIKALTTASKAELYPCENDDNARAAIGRAMELGEPQVYESTLEGLDIDLETRFVARDEGSVLAIVRDITERKKAENRIHDLAFYDELTMLPNRRLFEDYLDQSIEYASSDGQRFAILFIDLDRFKRINDTLGHSIGDELLKSVANRLEECVRSTDCCRQLASSAGPDKRLARFGGDEFVLKLHGVESEEEVAEVASRIVSVLTPPFNCDGHQFVITPSIGIALYPEDGRSSEELVMNADSAMYRAKSSGRNNYKFFSETMRTKSLHRLDLENEIRRATEDQLFELYYQPKVDIDSWTIVGAEALLRWSHPERGNISPAEFIPIAEETGMITAIQQWVLREACKELSSWSSMRPQPLTISVNISSHHFHGGTIVDDVRETVSESRIDPRDLELEITESVLLLDTNSTVKSLRSLKAIGVALSIDDFGTGYSSLSYLSRLPIDTLKIDRSFVENLHRQKDDAAICAAIIAIANRLGLHVVAEGVEVEEQLEFLKRHGCRQIQGFLYSKAIPAREFRKLISDSSDLATGS
jgi:diguanylate cyclase (GGDEF)-like protein